MTDEQGKVLTKDDIGVSIDPSSWTEPVQTFPGLVVESNYRLAPDSYKAETEFRPAITEDLPQWSLKIKRLDAVLVTPEGEEVDAIRYGGIDLKKWSPSEGKVVKINPNFAKEHFVVTEWTKIAKDVEPPEILEGRIFMFSYWANKRFGRMSSRNVIVPASTLSVDYVFPGEIQSIQIQAKDDDATNDSTDGGSVLSHDDAVEAVLAILPGMGADLSSPADKTAILEAIPAEARLNAIVTGIVTGTLLEELLGDGRINKNEAGVFVA